MSIRCATLIRPYARQGIADFHAAGRHTHITELLRNGATLPEAKELARHTDVKMTMRYAHIGIQDQARALRGLPVPLGCQDNVRKVADSRRPDLASADSDWQKDDAVGPAVNRGKMATSDAGCQQKTPPKSGGVEWRRRESNEKAILRNCDGSNYLRQGEVSITASWECDTVGECHDFAQLDSSMREDISLIAMAWPSLSPHIRDAILSLAKMC